MKLAISTTSLRPFGMTVRYTAFSASMWTSRSGSGPRRRCGRARIAIERLPRTLQTLWRRFDRQLRHLYVNAAGERATGFPAEKVVGKTNRELGMDMEVVAAIENQLHCVFATGQPIGMEYQYSGPTGTSHYETRFEPEFAADGAVESVLAITRDIGERSGRGDTTCKPGTIGLSRKWDTDRYVRLEYRYRGSPLE